jgi:hypothetical protein
MEIVEFHTMVKNGKIEIPREYKAKLNGHVHVILISTCDRSPRRNLIDRLLAQPIQAKGFRSLHRENIYAR